MLFTIYLIILFVSLFLSVLDSPAKGQRVTEVTDELQTVSKEVSQKWFSENQSKKNLSFLGIN